MKGARTIVITGASAGLGEALALAYAAPRRALGLIARNESSLERVAAHCREKGASAEIGVLDVTEGAGLARWMRAFDAKHPIDLVIANAGVFTGHGPGDMETVEEIAWMVRTNLDGVAITAAAALPMMRARKRGRLAIISSLAALQPLADAPGYSASKAAVRSYGEALREYLIPDNVAVSLVYPGHIKTAQVAHHVGPLPRLLAPEVAAAIIKRGLDRDRSVIAFPREMLWLIRVGRALPWRLRAQLGQGFRFHVHKPKRPAPAEKAG